MLCNKLRDGGAEAPDCSPRRQRRHPAIQTTARSTPPSLNRKAGYDQFCQFSQNNGRYRGAAVKGSRGHAKEAWGPCPACPGPPRKSRPCKTPLVTLLQTNGGKVAKTMEAWHTPRAKYKCNFSRHALLSPSVPKIPHEQTATLRFGDRNKGRRRWIRVQPRAPKQASGGSSITSKRLRVSSERTEEFVGSRAQLCNAQNSLRVAEFSRLRSPAGKSLI